MTRRPDKFPAVPRKLMLLLLAAEELEKLAAARRPASSKAEEAPRGADETASVLGLLALGVPEPAKHIATLMRVRGYDRERAEAEMARLGLEMWFPTEDEKC
jgi:hypothetical protein